MVTDARERTYIENYIAEAGRAIPYERLFVVPAGSPEAPRLGVLFGTFDERGEASAALASLPESLKQFRPYVRPLEAVREDARRAERKRSPRRAVFRGANRPEMWGISFAFHPRKRYKGRKGRFCP